MSTKKMSYAVAIDTVLSGAEITDEVRERLEALKVSLEKRNSRKANGPTKAQRENAALAEKIVEAMEPDVVYETKAIGGLVPELSEASTQKLTALMKGLVTSERVVAEKVKGKATYHLA